MTMALGSASATKLGVDLIGREDFFALLGFGFLAHAGPGVGVDDVGALDGLMRVAVEVDLAATLFGKVASQIDGLGLNVIPSGTRMGEVAAQLGDDVHEGDGNVIAIADKSHVHALERAEFFDDGQGICHGLAGMVVIAQAVDDGNAGPLGQFENVLVSEDTRHDAVDIAGQGHGPRRRQIRAGQGQFLPEKDRAHRRPDDAWPYQS